MCGKVLGLNCAGRVYKRRAFKTCIPTRERGNDEIISSREITMTLNEILKTNFNIDLNLSGGMGNSKDQAIILPPFPDYVSMEYQIMEYLGTLRDIQWELLEQTLIAHNDRALDQMKIKTVQKTDTEIITQVENFYFDITDCMNMSFN